MKNRSQNAWDLLCPTLQRYLIRNKWKKLSEIQEKAIPEILDGKNALLIAPTASGKTEAAVLPMVQVIQGYKNEKNEKHGITGLMIVPLRALLNDLEMRVHEIANEVGLQAFKWHGDVERSKKLRQKQDPTDILMTTPESLEGMFISEHIPHIEWFKHLRICVVDEAHNFLGGWRGVQLISLLERIRLFCKNDFQRVALSATVGNPEELLCWLSGTSQRGKGIIKSDKGRQGLVPQKHMSARLFPSDDDTAIHQYLASLSVSKKVISFCNSRADCERLGSFYRRHNMNSSVHHSSISKQLREKAEERMKFTDSPLVIAATSTLELGINIGKLDCVNQLGACHSAASFVQRLGRTGRLEGKPQIYDVATNKANEFLITLATMNLSELKKVEPSIPGRKLYHLLIQQWSSICLSGYGLNKEEARKLCDVNPTFHDIDEEEVETLLQHLTSINYFHKEDDIYYVGNHMEKTFGKNNYMELVVVFDSPWTYDVYHGRKNIGTIAASFVHNLPVEFAFTLAGRTWIFKKIDTVRSRIYVESVDLKSRAPIWDSFGFGGISYIIAQEVARILAGDKPLPWINDPKSNISLQRIREEYKDHPPKLNAVEIVNCHQYRFVLRTFFGEAANSAISRILESLDYQPTRCTYQGIIFDAPELKCSQVIDSINDRFTQLLSSSDPAEFGLHLKTKVRSYRFSKFATVIPEDFIKRYLIANHSNFGELQKILRDIEFKRVDTHKSKAIRVPISTTYKLNTKQDL